MFPLSLLLSISALLLFWYLVLCHVGLLGLRVGALLPHSCPKDQAKQTPPKMSWCLLLVSHSSGGRWQPVPGQSKQMLIILVWVMLGRPTPAELDKLARTSALTSLFSQVLFLLPLWIKYHWRALNVAAFEPWIG